MFSVGFGTAFNPVQTTLGPLHDLAIHAGPHPVQHQPHHPLPQQPPADPITGQLATRFYPAGSQLPQEDTKLALARQPWSGLSPATEAAQRLLSGHHVVHQVAEQHPGLHPTYPLRQYSHYDVWRHHYLGQWTNCCLHKCSSILFISKFLIVYFKIGQDFLNIQYETWTNLIQ